MYYPAFLDVRGRLCVVIGGGRVATRKVKTLVSAGARVRVVAPKVAPAIARLSGVEVVRARYSAAHLRGAEIVFATTNDPAVQSAVWREARKRKLLCNSADSPERSDFIVPASFARGDLQVAVSTGGASPRIAQMLRDTLERAFGPEWGDLLAAARERRAARSRS